MKAALQSSDLQPQQASGESDGPDLLRQVDVCQRLGISDETWRRWRQAGRTPAPVTLPSGRLKWRVEDIDRMAGRQPAITSVRRRYFQSVSHDVRTVTSMTLRAVREAAKMTQEDLAEKAGVDQTTISDLERGRNRNPSWQTVKRIADALSTTPDALFPLAEQHEAAQ